MAVILFLVVQGFFWQTASAACDLKDSDLVELKMSVACRCQSDLKVCDELFSFNTGEGLPAATQLGGFIAGAINTKLMNRDVRFSMRELGAHSSHGASRFMMSAVSECDDPKLNNEMKQFLAQEIPDQKSQLSDGAMCGQATNLLSQLRFSEFTGQCTSEGLLAFPKEEKEFRFKREKPNRMIASIKSKGDPTADNGTKRPFTVTINNDDINVMYSLPFVDSNSKRISPSPEEESSVKEQIKEHLKDFVQMHGCCVSQDQTAEEKRICARYQVQYLPQRDGRSDPGKRANQ